MTTFFEGLHGEISGSGPQTILLSHGFGSDKSVWAGLRPWLEARFTVISFDLAGSGLNGETSYDSTGIPRFTAMPTIFSKFSTISGSNAAPIWVIRSAG